MAEEPTQEQLDRVAPWALVLKDMCDAVEKDLNNPGSGRENFGQMLLRCCVERGVPYPPEDIKNNLILHAARRAMKGAPAPKGFA